MPAGCTHNDRKSRPPARKQVFFAESLPKNTAGKLLKRELRLCRAGTSAAVIGLEA